MSMQIVMAQLQDHPKAPTTGAGIYVIADEHGKSITLLHPATLTEFDISIEAFRQYQMAELWPSPSHGYENNASVMHINTSVANVLRNRVKEWTSMNRSFPALTIRKVLAALEGKPLAQIPELRSAEVVQSHAKRGFAAKVQESGKPGVVDTIFNIFKKPHSVDEALDELRKIFPERSADGMKTTIRCQLQRLPAKKGVTRKESFVRDRGRVYVWEK